MRTANPNQPLDWHLRNCELHARNQVKPEDALGTPMQAPGQAQVTVGEIEIQGERITGDALNRVVPLLSEMQQRVLFFLMKGCGVRETGRQLGITHPAVIKHRKKIVRIVHQVQESQVVGVAAAVGDGTKENGNGHGSQSSIDTGNGSGDHQI